MEPVHMCEVSSLALMERALFVHAVTSLVDEQRQVLGNEVLRYAS